MINKTYDNLVSGRGKLAVVGLGYVGLPIAVEFAKHINVIGYDVDEKRIQDYLSGIDPTNEVGAEIKATNAEFTNDKSRLAEACFIIVAVPTPVDDAGKPDLMALKDASKIIGQNLSSGTVVVFESTVYPGVTESVCLPIIESESGLKCGYEWELGYSPERINPGDKIHTVDSIVKVIAGMDENTTTEIKKVYDIIVKVGTYSVSTIQTAEAIKVIENTQRDVNIAFMNEVAKICDRMKIDTNEVLAGMNTKWNALDFKPGLVGGHCIGIDPIYLNYAAEQFDCCSQLIYNSRLINDSMSTYVADNAIKTMQKSGLDIKNAVVIIMGITFKENCPDIRNSKVVDIVHRLKDYGINPIITDPWADRDVVQREYNIELVDMKSIPKADCIIIAVGHREYRAMPIAKLKSLFKENSGDNEKVIIDVKSLYRMDELMVSGMSFWRL